MNMDEILRNIYTDDASQNAVQNGGVSNIKTVDEVWKEIVAGTAGNREPEMTLEDFLTKAGAVTEDDVRIPVKIFFRIPHNTYSLRTATIVDCEKTWDFPIR